MSHNYFQNYAHKHPIVVNSKIIILTKIATQNYPSTLSSSLTYNVVWYMRSHQIFRLFTTDVWLSIMTRVARHADLFSTF